MSISSQNAQPQYVVTESCIPVHDSQWANLPVYRNPDVSSSPTEKVLNLAPRNHPKP